MQLKSLLPQLTDRMILLAADRGKCEIFTGPLPQPPRRWRPATLPIPTSTTLAFLAYAGWMLAAVLEEKRFSARPYITVVLV